MISKFFKFSKKMERGVYFSMRQKYSKKGKRESNHNEKLKTHLMTKPVTTTQHKNT